MLTSPVTGRRISAGLPPTSSSPRVFRPWRGPDGLAGKITAEAIAGQAERFDIFASLPHARFPGGRPVSRTRTAACTTYFRLRDML